MTRSSVARDELALLKGGATMGTFVIYIDHVGEYRWYFMSDNHEKIADSAFSYQAREDCEQDIRVLKRMAPLAKIQAPTRVETLFA